MRRLLLVLLALSVPLPALALEGGSEPGGLEVQASLEECGIGDGSVVCKINATFSGVEGAEYYTASVTRADGSAQDYGRVAEGEGGGSAGLWVSYVGAGDYTVTISAWGYNDQGKARVLERSHAKAEGDPERAAEKHRKLREATGRRRVEPRGYRPPQTSDGQSAPADQPAQPAECEEPTGEAVEDAGDEGAEAGTRGAGGAGDAGEGSVPAAPDAEDQGSEAADPGLVPEECPEAATGKQTAPEN